MPNTVDGPELVPVPAILSAVQKEIETLVALSESLEDVLSRILSSAALTSRELTVVQNFDILGQHLSGLSSFLRRVVPEASPEWRLDQTRAIESLKLASLAQRLSCAGEGTGLMENPTPSGEDGCDHSEIFVAA